MINMLKSKTLCADCFHSEGLSAQDRGAMGDRTLEALIEEQFAAGRWWVPLGINVLAFVNPFTSAPRFAFPSLGVSTPRSNSTS